jgi:hypothetical protein
MYLVKIITMRWAGKTGSGEAGKQGSRETRR